MYSSETKSMFDGIDNSISDSNKENQYSQHGHYWDNQVEDNPLLLPLPVSIGASGLQVVMQVSVVGRELKGVECGLMGTGCGLSRMGCGLKEVDCWW